MLANEKEFDTLMNNCVSYVLNGLVDDKNKFHDLFFITTGTSNCEKTSLSSLGAFFTVFVVNAFFLKLIQLYKEDSGVMSP